MTQQRYAYEDTEVPVAKSQEEMRRLLMKHGAVGLQLSEFISDQMVEVKWARAVMVNGERAYQPRGRR